MLIFSIRSSVSLFSSFICSGVSLCFLKFFLKFLLELYLYKSGGTIVEKIRFTLLGALSLSFLSFALMLSTVAAGSTLTSGVPYVLFGFICVMSFMGSTT